MFYYLLWDYKSKSDPRRVLLFSIFDEPKKLEQFALILLLYSDAAVYDFDLKEALSIFDFLCHLYFNFALLSKLKSIRLQV